MPRSTDLGLTALLAGALLASACSQADEPDAPEAPTATEEQALDRAQEMIDSRPGNEAATEAEREPQGDILPVESTAPMMADTPDD